MKKIIFGILSILLISPVFADDYFPGWSENIVVSIESLSTNNNISYLIGKYGSIAGSFFSYINSSYELSQLNPSYTSLSQGCYGSSISSSCASDVFLFGGSTVGNFLYNYNALLAFNFSGNLPVLGKNVLYLQKTSNDSATNKLISFGSDSVDYFSSVSFSDGFVRYFYNSGFGFNGLTPSYSDYSFNPVGVQIFGSAYYTLTNKGYVFDYAGQNLINKNWVISSYLDGYSYILYSGDNLSFHSVLPGFSQFVTGSYNIPYYLETDKFLLFRADGNIENGNISKIGVLGLSGNNILFSLYSCDGLSLTEIDGVYHYNFDSACSFLNGGYINSGGVSSISRCGSIDLKSFFSREKNDFGCNPSSYKGKFLGLSLTDNSLNLISTTELNVGNQLINRYNVSFPITSDSSINLLEGFDNTYIPSIPLSPEESRDRAYDIICKINPNNPICKEFGYTTGSYDISFTPDGSGGLLATVTLYDEDDGSCPEIYFTGSDGVYYHQYFDRVCYNVAMIPREDSSPQEDLTSELTGLENNINLAFSGIVGENFKFYSCPFNSPLKAFHLSSIGGLSSFLLDKFFDVNLVGPFNCLLGGILYSETDSLSLGSRLLSGSYNGQKYLNNFSADAKNTISWLLFSGMVLFFWSFRPKDH